MNFLKAMQTENNRTLTQNGANAMKSTNNALLDFYGAAGALRHSDEIDIANRFSMAFAEDPLLAMKLLFYTRDIRGGLGERRTARIIYLRLAKLYPKVIRKNLELLSYYGRWDDLLVLLNTELKGDVIALIKKQLETDLVSDNPSLMAKWLPSINTSSDKTVYYAKMIAKGLNFNAKKYRQTLSKLRKKIDVVEVKMSSGKWVDIDYERVPSNAMNIYSKAFMGNDVVRFTDYIEAVKSGDKSINSSVLYPYNIVEKILYTNTDENLSVLEQQWNNMPDFVEDNNKNILVMADVSGSMYGRPMATSIGLALYFAQRSTGVFKDHFMTFSESPSLVKVTGDTLYEKVMLARGSNWGMNTNFEKALKLILDTALKNKAKQADMPESLIVVSDMQFDASRSCTNKDWTFYRKMKDLYKKKGYKIPEIVFWNVNNLSNAFQVSFDTEGVKLASGQSTSVFKSILNSGTLTPYDFMLEVLSDERYDRVAV